MIFVSGCLVGINCKYSGGNNFNEKIFNMVKEGKAIPICPEQLGGLSTPRNPSEIKIIDGKRRVMDNQNSDVTENFERRAIRRSRHLRSSCTLKNEHLHKAKSGHGHQHKF